jgi:8-oxo-dGTP diphosphatase
MTKVKVAAALLILPDGRVVLQRRSKDAAISAGKLGFFGGHVEPGETSDAAIKREMAEETSLDVEQLSLECMRELNLSAQVTGNDDVHFDVYRARVANGDFGVYEGDGAEVYSISEALARDDLTASARTVLAATKEN